MGLLARINDTKPIYTLEKAARMLADSDCELRDHDLVLGTLVGLGLNPWTVFPHDDGSPVHPLEIWIEAHNLRTLRLITTRSYSMPYSGY